jgi:choline dehydrogenase-like flavoprotein
MTTRFDHIVVGGGSAGCVVANRLVSEHGASVLVLEAGGSHRRPLVNIPAGAFKMMFGHGDYLARYQSAPQPSLGGRTVEIAQGNLLGGGSSVNAMTYMRGASVDYDRWDTALGGAGWGWNDLLPYFIRQEGNGRLGGPTHGVQGPFKVEDHRYVCSVANLFLDAMGAMGVQRRDDFNGGQTCGAGLTQISTSGGRRCSAAGAFLDPLARDQRLTVRTGASVEAILFDGKRAVGVRYFDGSAWQEVRCTGEIFLTAGAYNSPKLLMLSGLGNAEELKALDIAVLSDLPGVGQNMQDHNMVPVMAATEPGHGYHGEDRGVRLAWNALRYALARRGPLASNGSEAVAFVNPDQPDVEPTVQIYCMGFLPPGASDEPGMMLCPTLIQPKSRGWMRLASANPKDKPIISPNYFSDPDDLALMVRSIEYCREVLRSSPLREIVRIEIAPGAVAESTDELAEYCRSGTFTNYHPVGSCRLGSDDDSMAVVDARLRVRGVEGLRVCDASIMPRIPSANTNAPAMAIADKCVDLWAEDTRP